MAVAESSHGAPRAAGLVGRLGMLLGIVVAIVVSMSATAEASSTCADLVACDAAANTEKAATDEFSNKAAWFRATSRGHFINSYEWGQKATFAFHAGDATAAALYKALADDYSRKAVADANAADHYANLARIWAAELDNSLRRYVFIANSPEPGDGINTAGQPNEKDGTKFLNKAKVICNRFLATRVACRAVESLGIDGAVRYVWKMVNGRTCLRTVPHYVVNPSSGYYERVWHECVKWK